MSKVVEGGYLSLWGVAILLCWASTLRLINMAHVHLARRGWIRAPRHVLPPVAEWGDLGITLVALACGNAALVAFAGTALNSLHLPHWLIPGHLSPWLRLVRILCGLVVLVFFLTRVAENARYKLIWAACWCVFSVGVVSLA